MTERIGFGMRLGAALIDVVIMLVGGVVVGLVFGGILGSLLGAAGGAGGAIEGAGAAGGAVAVGLLGMIMGAMIGLVVFGVLYGLIEAFTGASPGKMILKIKIRNADASEASIGTLFGRYALKNVGMLAGLLAGITGITFINTVGQLGFLIIVVGCFFVLGSARQAIHDKIVKTAVYSTAAA